MPNPTIVWFRQDLRIADQPALAAAAERGGPVIPVYLYAPEEEGDWPPGGASRWWLHHSLVCLKQSLDQQLGLKLIVRRTQDSLRSLRQLCEETQAEAVFWNRRYEPAIIERDRQVKEDLRDEGIVAESFNGSLLFEPWELATQQDRPYRVYTPFSRACLAKDKELDPLPAPRTNIPRANQVKSLGIDQLELLPKIDWAGGMRETWAPGEAAAQRRLLEFIDQRLASYEEERNRPDRPGSSRLSPHLHFGELSPRHLWQTVLAVRQKMRGSNRASADVFLREILWREFAYHLMYHFPESVNRPLQPRFHSFPWLPSRKNLRIWQRGRTGYPLVDAGMRELWHTGWMHNRVRMLVASFLTKHLLIPWQQGAKWFWDALVDADLANNSLGWQWTAGCGADAAPFVRIFNPTSQAERFDPQGDYIRRWIPELRSLSPPELFVPWKQSRCPPEYPLPMIDHAEARQRALDAFAETK